jgi:hypothetical protein
MVIVQLISQKTGQPVKGKKVSVEVNHGLWGGGITNREPTNAKGEVDFPKAEPCAKGVIYIDGKSVYKGKIEGFNRIYI